MSTEFKPKSWKDQLNGLFGHRPAASPAPSATPSTTNVQSSDQGTAEHGSKASSIIATESCAPPSPSAAAARAARPSADARAPDDHQPLRASQELPPALPAESAPKPPPTESTEQPTPVLSVSERLWNDAYDSLEADNPELVLSYVRTLETALGANSGVAPDTNISTELHNPTKRQMHMRRLITNGVGDVASFVLSAKGLIDLAVQSVPQAALPWAGVCVGLQVSSRPSSTSLYLALLTCLQILLNPAQATKSNLAGIAHVISRMDWYYALTEHLLNENNVAAGKDFQAVLCQLEKSIVELYKALLQYQMKSVCSYYRNQGLVFLGNIFIPDDWEGDLKLLVTDAEAAVQNDATQSFQEQTKTSLGKLVEHAEGMERRLGDIRRDIRDFISSQKDARRDDIEAACHRDLRVVDPQHHMERIENSKDKLLDDAYNWILRTLEYAAFTNWDDSGFDRHAGTGKTMLIIGLIRQLSYQPVALSPALSFFFCQGTDAEFNNATAVLRSLIWLLLLQQPCLISHLLQKHKESGPELFKDKNAFYALSEAFRNMLKDPQLSPVYLAVDALDECAQGQSDLIHLISTSLTLSQNVKWLVSSRPTVEVSTPGTVGSLVELDTQKLEQPVNAYINNKLSAFVGKPGFTEQVLHDVSVEILDRAGNTFLWVWFVFKELGKTNNSGKLLLYGRDALVAVKKCPPGLSRVYGRIMDMIDGGGVGDSQVGYPQYFKNVLAAATLALRPLTLPELGVLANLPPDMPRTIVEDCGSFLTIKEETVYLIHQSAKDYLDENYTSKLQPAGVAQGHADISRRSIDAMASILRQNIYDLDFGFKSKDISPPPLDPLAPIRYSYVFWADHLLNAETREWKEALVDDRAVFSLLKVRFLHWLESLSLIGKLSSGLLSIRKILHAAQAYGSALVFSPTLSEIRKRYWEERLSFIAMTAGIRDHWGAHRATLEGHGDWVRAVAAVSSLVPLQDRQGKGPLRNVAVALPNDDEVEESEDEEDEEVDEEDEGEEADEANRDFQSLQAGRDDSNRGQPQTLEARSRSLTSAMRKY
ncbi:hypothetical protein N658DRAFT_517534 [Parathielavia hyrcaniae]|uniref:NACHT domain-containing protein n=1 Tax=Parathielavia hyrcaniae TaxID=113614 RepID=A0AAN6SZE4_9PEZI|nr:hypothetical protein N658DRAFT_517534 [Parathielavia hyrcaniae]